MANNRNRLLSLAWLILLIILVLLPLAVGGQPYILGILVSTLFNVVLAITLRQMMIMERVSFAQAAFLAIGAYGSALLTMQLGISFWLGLPLVMAVAAVTALALGIPTLKLKGPAFFLGTFAFLEVVVQILTYFRRPFGGPGGVVGIPPPDAVSLPGLSKIAFSSTVPYYYLILAIAGVVILILYRLEHSSIGRLWYAMGENDGLAQSLGVNILRWQLVCFCVACALVAPAGAVFGRYYTYISPDMFSFWNSIFAFVYVVVGGTGNIIGPILGAAVLTIVPETFRAAAAYEAGFFAVLLIAVALFFPDGLLGLPRQVAAGYGRIRKRLSRARVIRHELRWRTEIPRPAEGDPDSGGCEETSDGKTEVFTKQS